MAARRQPLQEQRQSSRLASPAGCTAAAAVMGGVLVGGNIDDLHVVCREGGQPCLCWHCHQPAGLAEHLPSSRNFTVQEPGQQAAAAAGDREAQGQRCADAGGGRVCTGECGSARVSATVACSKGVLGRWQGLLRSFLCRERGSGRSCPRLKGACCAAVVAALPLLASVPAWSKTQRMLCDQPRRPACSWQGCGAAAGPRPPKPPTPSTPVPSPGLSRHHQATGDRARPVHGVCDAQACRLWRQGGGSCGRRPPGRHQVGRERVPAEMHTEGGWRRCDRYTTAPTSKPHATCAEHPGYSKA